MNIIYNSPIIIKQIDKNDTKIIKDLKKFKKEMCYRKETLTKKEYNISITFYLLKINDFIEKDNYFGFVILQKVNIYNKISDKPVSVLIARKSNSGLSYVITLLCRHQNTQKGLGTLLINEIIKKARENNIDEIFLESTIYASTFYEKLGFKFCDKKDITESEDDVECVGYLLKLDQKGGYINKITIKKQKKLLKLILDDDNYLLLDKSLHITNRKMFIIEDYKYTHLSKIKELLDYLEYISIINNISMIEIELIPNPNQDLLTYLIQNKATHKFKEVFPNTNIFRKIIK